MHVFDGPYTVGRGWVAHWRMGKIPSRGLHGLACPQFWSWYCEPVQCFLVQKIPISKKWQVSPRKKNKHFSNSFFCSWTWAHETHQCCRPIGPSKLFPLGRRKILFWSNCWICPWCWCRQHPPYAVCHRRHSPPCREDCSNPPPRAVCHWRHSSRNSSTTASTTTLETRKPWAGEFYKAGDFFIMGLPLNDGQDLPTSQEVLPAIMSMSPPFLFRRAPLLV